MFLSLPEKRLGNVHLDFSGAFGELRETLRKIGCYREIFKFLIARLIYNDGLVTVFAFGGIYAAGTFGLTLSEVIVFGVAINIAAGLGAVALGFLDDKIGGKNTIMVTLVVLCAATGMAVWAPTRTWFWVAGMLIGLFVGPNQSASRSLMGRFVPDKHQSEFFGFFNLFGKVTSFFGPILLGTLTAVTGSQRAGVATVLLFFLIGGTVLASVDERKGMEAAKGE